VKKSLLLAAFVLAASSLSAAAAPAAHGWLSCADFQRNADGSWTTRHAAPVELPGGNATIASGALLPATGTYMGVQFGFLLDQQCGHAARR